MDTYVSATNADIVLTVPINTNHMVENGLSLWYVEDISREIIVTKGNGENYGIGSLTV